MKHAFFYFLKATIKNVKNVAVITYRSIGLKTTVTTIKRHQSVLLSFQWRRYARSWQVLCPATEKIGPGAGTCL